MTGVEQRPVPRTWIAKKVFPDRGTPWGKFVTYVFPHGVFGEIIFSLSSSVSRIAPHRKGLLDGLAQRLARFFF